MTTPPSHEQDVPAGVLDDDIDLAQYPSDLPPIGSINEDPSTHGQALAFLYRIGRVADQARQDRLHQAEINAKIYEWGKSRQPADGDVISNEIQSQVLSITDLQTREPFMVLIRPVQTRDKSPMFWIGPPVDAQVAMLTGLPMGLGMEPVLDPLTGQPQMQQQVDPMSGALIAQQPMMQPATSYQPLDEVTAWQIKKASATGAFPSEWFVTVDDRLVSDVYQTVFDLFWQDCHLDDFVRENVLKTNIYGYQVSSYGWDVHRKMHLVRDISIKQVYLDPQAEGSSFDLQNCPGYEVVLDIDQAKAEWPQLADLIHEKAAPGYPKPVDSTSQFGVASDRNFEERNVTLRVHWFRNQPIPMTPEEAIEAGLVMQTQNPLTGETEYADPMAQAQLSAMPMNPAPAQGDPNAVQEQSPAGMDVRQQAGNGEALAGGNAQGQAPAEEGQEQQAAAIAPPALPPTPAPQWPMALGIRQMATLAQTGRICQDIRCEHWDIPMLLNVCIALPSQPFGQGLPEKLYGMQQADIRLLSAIVDYAERFSVPGCMFPKSVGDQLQKGMKTMHVDPSRSYSMPDELIEKWGEKSILWFQPPPLPPAVPQVMELLQARTDKSSGHPEVMSGTPPSPTSSGRLVESLQAAAAGQFGFQAQWTAKMVQRLANLMHYSHLWRLELADIKKIYSRLPDPILEMVVDRARRNKWDIQVDANSSASGQQNKKLQRALALFQARSQTGEPAMPLKMLRDEANIDHEEASMEWRAEMQQVAPPAGQEPPPDEGGNEPTSPDAPVNGNGQHAANGNGRF